PFPASPRLRLIRRFLPWVVVAMAAPMAAPMAGQQLSNLEPERPVTVEDARAVPYGAFSGSVDWTYSERRDGFNDYGPGFSLLYGAARGLETGAALRYVTRPRRNAGRGISSGDLFLHALYEIHPESATWPALAVRAEVQLPTGLDSKGTDIHLTGLATRSFDTFRLHANFRYTREGATAPTERFERYEGVAGIDFLLSRRGRTDMLALADVVVRTNPIIGGPAIITIEAGARRRIGSQTSLFGGAGTDLTGPHGRTKVRVRFGVSQMY
ncbi:MAG TPA: hypothetical protein VK780_09500, partial [Thermoanaerobaculia bacterium]|nr:hypothetical protein [Thermoanaerobaculia bacterium]